MKTIFLLTLSLMVSVVSAQQTSSSLEALRFAENEQAIRRVALDYIEGWYSADTVRMARALSTDLKKRGFIIDNERNEIVAEATYEQMIVWTGNRNAQLSQKINAELTVEILEVGERIANVKTITPDFIDYIHLGKIDGEWKIFNVVWERRLAKE